MTPRIPTYTINVTTNFTLANIKLGTEGTQKTNASNYSDSLLFFKIKSQGAHPAE